MAFDLPIEQFVPRLTDGVEVFDLPNGDTGIYSLEGSYARIPASESRFLEHIDGKRTLTEITLSASQTGRFASVRSLLRVVKRLAQAGALTNSSESLEHYGLDTIAPKSNATDQLVDLFFRLTYRTPALGRHAEAWLHVLQACPVNITVLLAFIVVFVLMGWNFSAGLASALGGTPLFLAGSFALGMLAVYLGAVFALTLRTVFRAWILLARECGIFSAGIQMRLFVFAPYVDGRHIFRRGPKGVTSLSFAGMAGACVATTLMLWGVSPVRAASGLTMQSFGLASIGATGVLLATVCPFLRSDLARIFESLLGADERGQAHADGGVVGEALDNLQAQAGPTDPTYLGIIISGFAWVVGAIIFVYRVMVAIIAPCTLAILETGSAFEVVMFVFLCLTIVTALAVSVSVYPVILSGIFNMGRVGESAEPELISLDLRNVRNAIGTNPIFAQLDSAAREKLVAATEALRFTGGDIIMSEGELGDSFYMMASGEAEVFIRAREGVLATLGPGDSFGELALLETKPRQATIRARGDVEIFRLRREPFVVAIEESGLSQERVTVLLRSANMLLKSPVFKDMAPTSFQKLLSLCERKTYDRGHVLTREGEHGEHFFIIESGRVVVTRENSPTPLAHLGAGDFFGEIALLSDSPRTATVTADEESVILSLDREGFRIVVAQDFMAGLRLENVAQERTHEGDE